MIFVGNNSFGVLESYSTLDLSIVNECDRVPNIAPPPLRPWSLELVGEAIDRVNSFKRYIALDFEFDPKVTDWRDLSGMSFSYEDETFSGIWRYDAGYLQPFDDAELKMTLLRDNVFRVSGHGRLGFDDSPSRTEEITFDAAVSFCHADVYVPPKTDEVCDAAQTRLRKVLPRSEFSLKEAWILGPLDECVGYSIRMRPTHIQD